MVNLFALFVQFQLKENFLICCSTCSNFMVSSFKSFICILFALHSEKFADHYLFFSLDSEPFQNYYHHCSAHIHFREYSWTIDLESNPIPEFHFSRHLESCLTAQILLSLDLTRLSRILPCFCWFSWLASSQFDFAPMLATDSQMVKQLVTHLNDMTYFSSFFQTWITTKLWWPGVLCVQKYWWIVFKLGNGI